MIKRLGNEDLTFDDRYSVVSDDDVAQPVKASGPQPFFDNRKYGYRSTKGSVVVVPQFNYAYPFENGHAIVKSGAFWGILALSDGKFDVTKRIVVKRRKNVDEVVEYNVTRSRRICRHTAVDGNRCRRTEDRGNLGIRSHATIQDKDSGNLTTSSI